MIAALRVVWEFAGKALAYVLEHWREIAIFFLLVALYGAEGKLKDAQHDLDTERADRALQAAQQQASTAEDALQRMIGAAEDIRQAAGRYATTQDQLGRTLAGIKKDLAHAPPLPADCLPDPVRVRALDEAIDAANRAATGQPPR